MLDPDATICACATALGGTTALLRLSGPQARTVLAAAGLECPSPWRVVRQDWSLVGGRCPCRVMFMPGPRSFTGTDLIEILVPGSAPLVDLATEQLVTAGAEPAPRGGFSRQALANGRLALDQAEAVLALTHAHDADAAARALERLRGGLAAELSPLRDRLLHLRALVEAGLDFIEEDDVQAFDPAWARELLQETAATIARWQRAAASLGPEPVVCLVGSPNAGKSALFAALTGAEALVSAQAGTTRDWLEAPWQVAGRRVRLIDTAGWLQRAQGLDAEAVKAGRQRIGGAALVLACDAPDAPLPTGWQDEMASAPCRVLATKGDLLIDSDAAERWMRVSIQDPQSLADLEVAVAAELGSTLPGEERQQRLLAEGASIVAGMQHELPDDDILAEHCRQLGDVLGDLIGATTTDDVLDHIFATFCIGK